MDVERSQSIIEEAYTLIYRYGRPLGRLKKPLPRMKHASFTIRRGIIDHTEFDFKKLVAYLVLFASGFFCFLYDELSPSDEEYYTGIPECAELKYMFSLEPPTHLCAYINYDMPNNTVTLLLSFFRFGIIVANAA